MAAKSTKGKNNTKKSTRKTTQKKTVQKKAAPEQKGLRDEIIILATLAVSVFFLISNFGLGGLVGDVFSSLLFGIFGWIAYLIPVLLFCEVAFAISNKGSTHATIKVAAMIAFLFVFAALLVIWTKEYQHGLPVMTYYRNGSTHQNAGGLIGGAVASVLCPLLGTVGANIVLLLLAVICIILITERSLLQPIGKGSKKVYEGAKRKREVSGEQAVRRREEKQRIQNARRMERQRRSAESRKRNPKSSNVVSGVSFATTLKSMKSPELKELQSNDNFLDDSLTDVAIEEQLTEEIPVQQEPFTINRATEASVIENVPEQEPEAIPEETVKQKKKTEKISAQALEEETAKVEENIKEKENTPSHTYITPSLNLLKKGTKTSGDSDEHLRDTAAKLEQTLQNFGVKVHVTNASCGPSVTRYELQPEQGVKVSKIVGLADDIKLNLAVTDLRIEAPIPGKAAVGIEVPNKENSPVMLRDLLESNEFQKSESKMSFAVGKDIAGKVMVADIAKMPHVLVAGATGSGKSVCINTLIMSILYKANPDEVKLIMIDPKVVELSVYNGIPHLLIPVVTDPKKAAGALNWAVAEMMKRYQLFAEYNVRDLNGFNEKVSAMEAGPDTPKKMPKIVIIVDELADLMMVAPKDVEGAICRLAQLARAAGLHLILATQRPSVNVITGLIKANMPSRIAFAVSSGVDSRTIIDMNGAEKLLGKGDMLFYPTGYPQPVRVQGSFVSDKEVQKVVDFLVQNSGGVSYSEELENHMNSTTLQDESTTINPLADNDSANERDHYFEDAGRLIIDKEKASIGMLQRMFKIGFNRAARIMDQLAEVGVVGPEEGTKPRKVLMTKEEFEQYLSEQK